MHPCPTPCRPCGTGMITPTPEGGSGQRSVRSTHGTQSLICPGPTWSTEVRGQARRRHKRQTPSGPAPPPSGLWGQPSDLLGALGAGAEQSFAEQLSVSRGVGVRGGGEPPPPPANPHPPHPNFMVGKHEILQEEILILLLLVHRLLDFWVPGPPPPPNPPPRKENSRAEAQWLPIPRSHGISKEPDRHTAWWMKGGDHPPCCRGRFQDPPGRGCIGRGEGTPPRVLLHNSASPGGGGLTPPTHPPWTPPPP